MLEEERRSRRLARHLDYDPYDDDYYQQSHVEVDIQYRVSFFIDCLYKLHHFSCHNPYNIYWFFFWYVKLFLFLG